MKKLLGTATAIMFAAGLAVSAHAQVVMHHEHHPELHKAKEKLEHAKSDLEHAAHDYGGHRVAAIKAIDAALGELHAAMDYDEHHEAEEHEEHEEHEHH
jgi:hypothetical protein